jgi:hypothetical protein
MVLRSTILHEDFWASAVFKAATKQASKSFEVKGRGADRWQQVFLDWGGDGYVPSQERAIIDFLSTNNGAFWEVVRVSNAAGSRIIGLVHLDSLRCIRTGDPEIPVVFCDLKGKYHELRTHQVLSLVDMPDPSSASLGIGHCAAERAYHHVYELSAIRQYVREKVTGSGANVLDFITGLNDTQLKGVVDSAREQAQARGQVYYQGHIITGLLAQVEPKLLQIKLRDLPDGFVAKEELETALLVYANAIGLDPQDIDPRLLGPRSMGVSAQASVLDEKQHALGLAAYDKQTTHLLNNWVLPTSVTFSFNERDLREEQSAAAVALAREQMRNSMILNGELTAQQGLQMAIESNDVPREFLPAPINTDDTPLSDEEKPIDQAAPDVMQAQAQPQATPQTAQPAKQPAPGQGLRKDTSAAVKELADALEKVSAEIATARKVIQEKEQKKLSSRLKQLVNRPEPQPQPAPQVNVTLPNISVRTPDVTIHSPISIPAQKEQAAPVVNVTNQINPTPVTVENQIDVSPTPIVNKVKLATAEERVTTIERDASGDMTRTKTQITRK